MVTRRMQEAYDAISGAYADRYMTMPLPLVDLGHRFLERLPVPPVILDAGCGSGRDMEWFEGNGARVIGIDLSLGMLAQARTRVEGALVQMDMTALAFPEHTFDGVWCMASLLHLPKASVPLALSELHRVLVPDGTLVLAVQEGSSEGWESGIYTDFVCILCTPGDPQASARADTRIDQRAVARAIVAVDADPPRHRQV